MANETEKGISSVPKGPIKVTKVLNDCKVVINRGSNDGIKKGQKFLIYTLSDEEIIDIDTRASLGFLEIVKGIGRVTHVQEEIATLESDERISNEKKTIRTTSNKSNLYGLAAAFPSSGPTVEEEIIVEPPEIKPFEDPQVGDKVKPI